MDESTSTLLTYISQIASEHKSWARIDFVVAQFLLWSGIIASVAAGVLAVNWNPHTTKGKTGKILIATIPALAVSAEQSFKFCQRYQWHDEYYSALHSLENSLRFENGSPNDVSNKEAELTRTMNARFPAMTLQTISGLGPSAEHEIDPPTPSPPK